VENQFEKLRVFHIRISVIMN